MFDMKNNYNNNLTIGTLTLTGIGSKPIDY